MAGLILSGGFVVAQGEDHGASSAHSQHNNPPGFSQPKRIGQYAVKQLLQGNPEQAEAYIRKVLEERPDDAEMHWARSLATAAQGRIDEAEQPMKSALEHGMPPGRFICGPRTLTGLLTETATYQSILKGIENSSGLIHGPMIGAVSDTTARIWVRTPVSTEVKALVTAHPDSSFKEPTDGDERAWKTTQSVAVTAEDDYTATLLIEGLQPDTQFHYRLVIGEKRRVIEGNRTFHTMPKHGESTKFRFAFGGGAGYTPPLEHMWDTIASFEPRLLLLLGDNVYSDDPQSPAIQRYSYYRRQSRPEWRKLVARTPVVTIWDDHDFSNNDSWGGPHALKPEWKPRVWEVFKQNWANPGYGGGQNQPGCWYDFHVGDVHFIMLDCRYYRTSPRLPESERSMLGPNQKNWLKKRLAESDATFKLVASSVPWDFRTKGDSLDTWNGYRRERNEIFSFLRDRKIEGVLLISADRHRSDAWLINQEAGKPEGLYDLYEFNSSRLTNRHVHGEKKEAIFSYNDKQSFGLVTVDTASPDATITYQVINIDGDKVHELTVHRNDLGW